MDEYRKAYKESIANPDKFWGKIADEFTWKKKWDKVSSGGFEKVDYKWFEGGVLNITENCLDRNAEAHPERVAFIWEPNDPEEEELYITYRVLLENVCRFANVLKKQGVKKGDTVIIYMPMIPELPVAMLGCARIGAIHSVVFGGFSAQSLADRIKDTEAKIVITADGVMRGARQLLLKNIVDEALAMSSSVKKLIMVNRQNFPVNFESGRDMWWNELMKEVSADCPAESVDAEHPLYILYTSGSTGKPKGVVHTTAGYMIYTAYTFLNVFQYSENDIYWCTADIGWVTGHSYIVYGPLLNGATTVLFEGVPQYPDWGHFWDVVQKYGVNIFYTAPTAIRSLEAQGTKWFEGKDLSSLKVLGTVGEPINNEAWEWYNKNVGNGKCPIVDTWWQTETGGILISPLAGITPLKPSFATLPLPGVLPLIVNGKGDEVTETVAEGNLCMKQSWPGQARTVYKDHERFKQNYFSTYKNLYFTGDGSRRDEDGYYRITGRVDDVINVSGHRIGTAEVENAINEHPLVFESAVVGFPHNIKGEGLFAFVTCAQLTMPESQLDKEILEYVSKAIGSFAKPDKIMLVSGLPKTRSGKIMRRILRKIAHNETDQIGDTTTLLNPEVVEEMAGKMKVD
jgi:acetyl-CoA synthetase